VGIQLALTLLSLVNSAWVHEFLDVNHIAVISSGERRPHGLYFFSNISGTARGPIARWDARSSLLMLGVLLLELFHGEKLEKQACWQDSLDNGSPNEYRFCGGGSLRRHSKSFWGRMLAVDCRKRFANASVTSLDMTVNCGTRGLWIWFTGRSLCRLRSAAPLTC
jgi:hypothetical protein